MTVKNLIDELEYTNSHLYVLQVLQVMKYFFDISFINSSNSKLHQTINVSSNIRQYIFTSQAMATSVVYTYTCSYVYMYVAMSPMCLF